MPSNFSRAVGSRVRALRTERGLSQEGFARDLGFDRAHYGRLERGEKGMSVITAAKIARALGVGLDEMFADLPVYDPEVGEPEDGG